MTYIEIGGARYAATVTGRMRDTDWGDRETKSIRLTMDHGTALETFVDDVPWDIVYVAEDGTETVYDNSDYAMAGEVTDNRDGTVTVKMAKPSAADVLAVMNGEV